MPGWTWDPFADDWQAGYEVLVAYIAANRHGLRPRRSSSEGNFALGKRATKQRTALALGPQADPDRKRDPRRDTGLELGASHRTSWEQRLRPPARLCPANWHLAVPGAAPRTRTGSSSVNGATSTAPSARQRHAAAPEQCQSASNPCPSGRGSPGATLGSPGFEHLVAYVERERATVGCRRSGSKRARLLKLGQWAQVQRTEHGKGRIKSERATRLEGISGWVWEPLRG